MLFEIGQKYYMCRAPGRSGPGWAGVGSVWIGLSKHQLGAFLCHIEPRVLGRYDGHDGGEWQDEYNALLPEDLIEPTKRGWWFDQPMLSNFFRPVIIDPMEIVRQHDLATRAKLAELSEKRR